MASDIHRRGPSYFTRLNNIPEPEKSASEILGIPYDPQFEQYYENDYKDSGLTLPFSNYIGPGNSLNLGTPRTHPDHLAKKHDLDYAHASYRLAKEWITQERFEELIEEADAEFVNNNNPFTPQGAHAISGISAKQLVEKFTGQLYPGSKPDLTKYQEPTDDFDFHLLGKHERNKLEWI